MNQGGVIFYEGNSASQNIVCGLAVGKKREVQGGNEGCENDEARSARFLNVPAGTNLVVFDSPSKDKQDDFTSITVKTDIGQDGQVVSSFESSFSNTYFNVVSFRNNGLDG